jgi:hypothetical protein
LEQAILRQEFLPAGVPTFVREWRCWQTNSNQSQLGQ